MNLEAPIEVLIKENVEFEILIERIQSQNERLEADNKQLLARDQITAAAIKQESAKKQANQIKAIETRTIATKDKDQIKDEHSNKEEEYQAMLKRFGKFRTKVWVFVS